MKTIPYGLGGCEILQTHNQSSSQMMGYLITASDGTLVVIDGGTAAEEQRLRERIKARGGVVSLWLLTHCHHDHIEAPGRIFARPDGIELDTVCYRFPSTDWLCEMEPHSREVILRFAEEEKAVQDRALDAAPGLRLELGGMTVEVLNDALALVEHPPEDRSLFSLNDSSAIYRFTFPNGVTALFLGDCGVPEGALLAGRWGQKLRSDIVQMAHHGQRGCAEPVYRLVRPQVCLWNAPAWLWNNDLGEGFDTGPFETVATRGWMDRLGVRWHGTFVDGDVVVR